MKKLILSSIALLIVATSTANATWTQEASATGTATVNGQTHWSIMEKIPGVFEQDGTATTPLTMNIRNGADGQSGHFALSTPSVDEGNWFLMTKQDDQDVKIKIKPVDNSVVSWDNTHNNYKSVDALSAGGEIDVPFGSLVGTSLTPGKYEITLNLLTETV